MTTCARRMAGRRLGVVESSITAALVAFFRSDEVVKVGMRRLRLHLLYGLKGASARYWHSADGPSVVSIAAPDPRHKRSLSSRAPLRAGIDGCERGQVNEPTMPK
jgi:hypothetical protein